MPPLLLIFFVAIIIYFFLPHHVLSRSGSRTTWLIRGFVFLNALAFWVGSDTWLSTVINPMWQIALRLFLLETCYVFALGALYSVKGWKMPRFVGIAIFSFYGVWIITTLLLLQTKLPAFQDTDSALAYSALAFIVMRIAAALSTLVLFFEFTRCFYRFWTGDQLLAGRLRFGFFALGTIFAFVNRLFVLVYIATLFFGSAQANSIALALEKNINLVATVFFLCGCLPPFVMKGLARGLVYLDQQRAIVELALLRSALIHTTAPLPWPLPDWRTRLQEPTYVLYSSIIDVLDRLWLLESMPSQRNIKMDEFESLHDPLAPDELLIRLRHIARRIWFRQLFERLTTVVGRIPVRAAQ